MLSLICRCRICGRNKSASQGIHLCQRADHTGVAEIICKFAACKAWTGCRVKGHGVGGVALVVDDQLGDVRAVEAAQHLIGHGQLFGGLCVARVGHLDDDIRERGLLQRIFSLLTPARSAVIPAAREL